MAERKIRNKVKLEKRLDLIAVILLARCGFKREDIADILEMSSKTIERMFKGKFRQIQKEER